MSSPLVVLKAADLPGIVRESLRAALSVAVASSDPQVFEAELAKASNAVAQDLYARRDVVLSTAAEACRTVAAATPTVPFIVSIDAPSPLDRPRTPLLDPTYKPELTGGSR